MLLDILRKGKLSKEPPENLLVAGGAAETEEAWRPMTSVERASARQRSWGHSALQL